MKNVEWFEEEWIEDDEDYTREPTMGFGARHPRSKNRIVRVRRRTGHGEQVAQEEE